MKLALRFSALIIVLTVMVLAVQGYLRVQQQVEFFRNDMRRDHRLIGRTLAQELAWRWRPGGLDEARQLIARADRLGKRIDIELVGLAGADGLSRPRHPDAASMLSSAGEDGVVSAVTQLPEGELLLTYVPFSVAGLAPAALELAEGLEVERRFVERTLVSTALATALLVLLASAATMFLGRRLIGAPVEALREKARRVGMGDLSGSLDLRRDDELGELADALDRMSARLERAADDLQHEQEHHAATSQQLASTDQARLELVEQLRHADRLGTVGVLTSSVTHELGTPLNVVSLHGKMIADGTLVGAAAQNSGAVIVTQVERMSRLIRQLLDFARARGHRRELVDAAALVESTIELLSSAARKAKVELAIEAPDSLMLHVDSGHLQQVLINLVNNGIQSMDDGGTVRITLAQERRAVAGDTAGQAQDHLVLTVQDQGRGIPADERARIFTPFYTTKEVGRGTGLGLSVVDDIVREHGGWIEVDSEVGVGSRFAVYLPAEGPP